MTARLPRWSRVYTLTPADVWAMTLEQFLVYCEDDDALEAAKKKR